MEGVVHFPVVYALKEVRAKRNQSLANVLTFPSFDLALPKFSSKSTFFPSSLVSCKKINSCALV